MRKTRRSWRNAASTCALLFMVMLAFSVASIGSVQAAAGTKGQQITRHIVRAGTNSLRPTATGTDRLQRPERVGSTKNDGGPALAGGQSPAVTSAALAAANAELKKSFDGLNFRQQRLANGGNQFSVEPPDQGLCVGNGFVLETVNDVLNVYSTSGKSLLGVTDLNTFYGYPPAINRTTGVFGPFVTDPSCYFDQPTQRWFHIALTLDVFPGNGAFTGTNHLDIAVSQTANPTGMWNFYHVPVQDDGTQGTPDHHCAPGSPATPPTNPNACLGDYPHLGADANGFYITTNEYCLFCAGLGFHAAQVYAFSKSALASGVASVAVTQIDTIGSVGQAGNPGFTVWPATSPDNHYATAQGGTEYFLSSDAAPEANGNGASKDLITWALTNTQSLNTSSPSLTLSNSVLTVNPYAIPPQANQKAGPFPLGQCLNKSSCATLILGAADPFHEVEGPLDSNDTRMQQVVYANGILSGALDTTLTVGGINKAGIEWFFVKPSVSSNGVAGKVVNQGYLGMANTNVIYPAIGVTASGKGVMAFTLVGTNNFPSAAYALIDVTNGVGAIHIAAAGKGPQDGFSEYKVFSPTGNGVPRPRWGDYGAAVAVGNVIWIASEYTGQSCTLAQYLANTPASPQFSCHMTRTALGNWYTRISEVLP